MNNLKNLKKILIIPMLVVFFGCNDKPSENIVFGYEMEGGNKIAVEKGDETSLKIIEEYFQGYNNKDLSVVEKLEHEDFLGYSHTGQVITGSKEHIELSKQFLDTYDNARWDIIWSISANIKFDNKPTENWVTTCLNVSFGEGEERKNFQRIFDAQIIENKISKAFLYQRTLSESEIN